MFCATRIVIDTPLENILKKKKKKKKKAGKAFFVQTYSSADIP